MYRLATILVGMCLLSSTAIGAPQIQVSSNEVIVDAPNVTIYMVQATNRQYNNYIEKMPDGLLRITLRFVGKSGGKWDGKSSDEYYYARCSTWEYMLAGEWKRISDQNIWSSIGIEMCLNKT